METASPYCQELRLREEEIGHLTAALAHARVIGAAVGILMERNGMRYDDAFAVLTRASQALNVKLHLVADRFLFSGVLPGE